MREIVVDTETTGLDPRDGHRLIEVACLELQNGVRSGVEYVSRINPERLVDPEAYAVHGISDADLVGAPVFAEMVADFLAFIGDDPLVIHNAEFDLRFINSELARTGHAAIPSTRAVDTLTMARRRFPGSPASLDALCRRFGIDTSARVKHGARLDAELLADVYLELTGGRQKGLSLTAETAVVVERRTAVVRVPRAPRPHAPTPAEAAAHAALVARIKGAIWLR
ncbi:DNA polymerase-3 subunit epsilon [Stella humosa]|uniref:DNA polymerase III subunit epsilon n=1 Tax=Stella humosa TaxID=94 RepID=A0A3N1LIH1_9PROT|nr:DNA polymerase III subunit epsilon [Stella humosa]ROP90964.1 DNA polymerase-3 subunit epsilon [Stella humosa]BBK34686.1 DNA polymerase III subunit epsilon [Stella humosa]